MPMAAIAYAPRHPAAIFGHWGYRDGCSTRIIPKPDRSQTILHDAAAGGRRLSATGMRCRWSTTLDGVWFAVGRSPWCCGPAFVPRHPGAISAMLARAVHNGRRVPEGRAEDD